MNFLGHCLLTQYNSEYISGNIGGDHFKGDLSKFKAIPPRIVKGIEIHRFIDSFTDNSDQIHAVAKRFQDSGVKRISYIASDLILDHFISKNWDSFSALPLNNFIKKIYQTTAIDLNHFPDKFKFIFSKMKEKDWLSRYITEDGIELTLYKFSKVIPFQNNLHDAFEVYQNQKEEIDQLYMSFMFDITKTVNSKFKLNVTL